MKYVIVTGGELRNKGAQAMTFCVVDQIAKRFSDCKVVLISGGDAKRPKDEKANYKFDIVPMPNRKTILRLCSPFRSIGKDKNSYSKYFDYFRNAIAVIDISGYALSSSWGRYGLTTFMWRIMLAKQNKIPMYIFPQSFGPFDFEKKDERFAKYVIGKLMRYPKVIMARESEGKELLCEKYGLDNVVLSTDMVLKNKDIDENNIYHKVPEFEIPSIKEGSIAVIPNQRNCKYGNAEVIYELYHKMIDELLNRGKNVYFIYHAIDDIEICKSIKQRFFENDDRVSVIEHEFSCLEFEKTVDKFEFVIASRYHSIVHSFKHGVPAVVFGWAIKYKELLEMFLQSKYQFDVRSEIDEENVMLRLCEMCENHSAESEHIKSVLSEIQKDDLFDVIKID